MCDTIRIRPSARQPERNYIKLRHTCQRNTLAHQNTILWIFLLRDAPIPIHRASGWAWRTCMGRRRRVWVINLGTVRICHTPSIGQFPYFDLCSRTHSTHAAKICCAPFYCEQVLCCLAWFCRACAVDARQVCKFRRATCNLYHFKVSGVCGRSSALHYITNKMLYN